MEGVPIPETRGVLVGRGMKTVSVIIPCYRDSATLARAIDSVLAQTYPAIEVVVVNDCSPETSAVESILARYPQVKYVRNSENLGLAGSRNAGIQEAKGEFVALLDADDEYLPGKIAAQMAAIEPGMAVTCGVLHVFADGRRQPSSFVSRGERLFDNPSLIQYRNTLNGAGLLIERGLLLSLGAFDASLRSCEDLDLWLRLLSAGIKVKDIGRPFYLYYANPAGLSKNFRNISKWEIEVIRRYAARKGESWMRSQEFASVATAWLLRQLLRCELERDGTLYEQVMANMGLLNGFPLRVSWLRLLARTRLMHLPAKLLRVAGGLRNT